ncbi:hypothetical protein AAF712_009938 [Marasmius tenuissimus]|uniref:Transmembrane protein n=1 Tax=Marasmius tenuissimus TaxID=585030 RepID=A0ABR2ZP85_9AGAR
MARPSDLEYPRRIVVDDTDPRITYDSGAWNFDASTFDNFGVWGDPYNRTMRGTNSGKAGFTFTFEGEYQVFVCDFIQVKGAKDNRKISRPSNDTNDPIEALPKYTCQVDGSAISTIGYRNNMYEITNNWLCEASRLSKGPHTLTMNITLDDPNWQIFWLDSIEYAYLEGADLSKEVVKIDSSDPVSCTYHNDTGSWRGSSGLFNGTGDTSATMSFRFNGSSVSLYTFNEGSESDWDRTSGRYYIDNTGDTAFDIPGSKPLPFNDQNRTDWLHQHLFTTNKVDGGKEHEMVITYTGAKTGSNSAQWLLIDYFYVTGAGASGSPEAAAGGPGGENGEGSGDNSGRSKTPVGAIAGGVVGGVVALLGIAGLIWLLMRRRRRRDGPRELYPKEGLNPFMFGPPGEHHHAQKQYHDHPQPTNSPLPASESKSRPPAQSMYSSERGTNTLSYYPATTETGTGSVYGSSSADGGTASVAGDGSTSQVQNFSDMKSAQREAVSVETRQHQDSGARYNQAGPSQVVDVPPSYTAD